MQHMLYQFAALINKGDINYTGPTKDTNVIQNILMPVYFWAGLLAVAIIVVAGFMYVLSNGNAQQVTRAKNAILGAVVGLILVLLAFVITNIVLGMVK